MGSATGHNAAARRVMPPSARPAPCRVTTRETLPHYDLPFFLSAAPAGGCQAPTALRGEGGARAFSDPTFMVDFGRASVDCCGLCGTTPDRSPRYRGGTHAGPYGHTGCSAADRADRYH